MELRDGRTHILGRRERDAPLGRLADEGQHRLPAAVRVHLLRDAIRHDLRGQPRLPAVRSRQQLVRLCPHELSLLRLHGSRGPLEELRLGERLGRHERGGAGQLPLRDVLRVRRHDLRLGAQDDALFRRADPLRLPPERGRQRPGQFRHRPRDRQHAGRIQLRQPSARRRRRRDPGERLRVHDLRRPRRLHMQGSLRLRDRESPPDALRHGAHALHDAVRAQREGLRHRRGGHERLRLRRRGEPRQGAGDRRRLARHDERGPRALHRRHDGLPRRRARPRGRPVRHQLGVLPRKQRLRRDDQPRHGRGLHARGDARALRLPVFERRVGPQVHRLRRRLDEHGHVARLHPPRRLRGRHRRRGRRRLVRRPLHDHRQRLLQAARPDRRSTRPLRARLPEPRQQAARLRRHGRHGRHDVRLHEQLFAPGQQRQSLVLHRLHAREHFLRELRELHGLQVFGCQEP